MTIPKSKIEDLVSDGSVALMEAEIAFRQGFISIENENYEEAVGAMDRSSEHLGEAIAIFQEILDLAAQRLEEGKIKQAGENLAEESDSPFELGEYIFEDIRRHAEIEGMFLDDPELWDFLVSKSLLDRPMAGYKRLTWMMREVRNSLDGYRTIVEDDPEADVLQDAAWKTSTLFMRTFNFANMLGFLNRETRPL